LRVAVVEVEQVEAVLDIGAIAAAASASCSAEKLGKCHSPHDHSPSSTAALTDRAASAAGKRLAEAMGPNRDHLRGYSVALTPWICAGRRWPSNFTLCTNCAGRNAAAQGSECRRDGGRKAAVGVRGIRRITYGWLTVRSADDGKNRGSCPPPRSSCSHAPWHAIFEAGGT
jgi:hypothetical protein